MKTAAQRIQDFKKNDEVIFHKLDKANHVIDQFITSCSHSMRGPLKSIRGLVNLLKDRTLSSELSCESILGYVEENVERMEAMLDGLEQFMINSAKKTEFKAVDLDELIHKTLSGFQEELSKQSICVMLESDQKAPFFSDLGRIRLVLTHFVVNAIKFQDPEKPDKKIIVRSNVNREKCTFSVEDNGIGIENDQLEKIFDLFYRASSISNGAGIGLFVVREAVEKMGGKITVKSTLGKGSVFSFSVPNRTIL